MNKRIVILGADGCLASGFTGLLDILTLASRAISAVNKVPAPFEIISASHDGNPVTEGSGRRLDVDASLKDIDSCDAFIIPGFVPDENNTPPQLNHLKKTAAWIRQQHAHGALACGSCSGVFLLGEAGLLDQRSCTTTWWLYDELKRRYPRATAQWGKALAEDKRVITAGGPLSWVDIALCVVKQLEGSEAARVAADYAVVDTSPSTQAKYVPHRQLSEIDTFLSEAEYLARQESGNLITARTLSKKMAVSERTFHRRIKEATGESPKQFLDRIRFEMARVALEDSIKPIKQIAADAGYHDESSFRRVFNRLAGMSPSAYRRWATSRKKG